MIKLEVFQGPLAWFFRATNALPIDRSAPRGLVDQTVDAYRRSEQLVIGVTPEGTRKRVDRWKRGFYYIAKGAGIPIVLVSWDYRRKVFGFGPSILPSDDEDADLAWMQQYFTNFLAKVPENTMIPMAERSS
jgi:1-acyl-sn-glycerol-3-phosphate acyltransferase